MEPVGAGAGAGWRLALGAGWRLALLLALARGAAARGDDRPHCAPGPHVPCVEKEGARNEYFYQVNNRNHMVEFLEGNYYKAGCSAAQLEEPGTPRFGRRMVFQRVVLEGCAPPRHSYAAALRALNVTALHRLVLRALPDAPRLAAAALRGLPASLAELELEAAPDTLVEPEPDFLAALPALKSLSLKRVRFASLPAGLEKLHLDHTGIETLPAEARNVSELWISEERLRALEGAFPLLERLTLAAPVRALPPAPALRELYAAGWPEPAPAPLRQCARLADLTLFQPAAERLPAGFVAECAALEKLHLITLRITGLPDEFLRGATDLTEFKLTGCNLTTIPEDLFAFSTKLADIDLTNNHLQYLPEGVFSVAAASLRSLSLYRNALHAADVRALAPLAGLTSLNLARNPLGDLCPDDSDLVSSRKQSALWPLSRLRELHLSRTNQTRLCADWARDLHALRRLDLRDNDVRALACADLRVHRAAPGAELELNGNPLRAVRCSAADYRLAAAAAAPKERAKLVVDSELACDCDAYWLARALNDSLLPVSFEPQCAPAVSAVSGAAVAAGTRLRAVPAGALACRLAAGACAGCACERAGAEAGLRARCAGPALPLAALAALPLPLLQLRAPGAGLTRLPLPLPRDLQVLDLHNNSISAATADEAAALLEGARRVRLTANPLRCACDNALMTALRARRAQVDEYENTTCADGRSLEEAARALACGAAADGADYLALGLALLGGAAAAVVAAAALLARPAARLRLKALLRASRPAGREPPDADRPFDAFVAHAEADARFVHERLAARLEPARRLCLAARDWPAGAWIPTQIEESVRRSRRTLVAVSARWLAPGAAGWARAQLRAARAHALREPTPRLLLLLLDVDAAAAAADAELAAALAAHDALRWGEPRFWERLEAALPPPRAHRPPEPPPPPPPPPAAA